MKLHEFVTDKQQVCNKYKLEKTEVLWSSQPNKLRNISRV